MAMSSGTVGGHHREALPARGGDAEDARAAREEAAYAPDPDERAAGFIARGYTPGLLQELAQRLGDTTAELEAENEKIEKASRRAERVMRMHANGQIRAWDIHAALGDDPDRVAQLERRAESLREQISEIQNMITPPQQRESDPVAAAASRARAAFAEVTRARMAEARAARPEPRPFDSVSRGRSTEHTGPDCQVCAAARERDAARDRAAFAAVYGEITR